MKNLKLLIFGKVQGVFFRSFVKKIADESGITGWVKNNKNGSVEIEAEGTISQLEDFLEKCAKGSNKSRIDRIEKKFSNILKEYKTFSILF